MMSTTLTTENEIPRFLKDLFHIFIGHCSQKWEPEARKMSSLKKSGRVFRSVENFVCKIAY